MNTADIICEVIKLKYIIAFLIYLMCLLGQFPIIHNVDPPQQPVIEETKPAEIAPGPTGGSERPQEPQTEKDDNQHQEQVFDGSRPSSDVTAALRADSSLLGMLYINDIGLKPTPLKICSQGSDLQHWADKSNAAYIIGLYSYYNREGQLIEIGDHINHNFGCLKNVKVGTRAYINRGDHVVRLKCVSTELSTDVNDYVDRYEEFEGYVVTITCAPGNNKRTINKWIVTEDSDLTFNQFWDVVTMKYETRYDGP